MSKTIKKKILIIGAGGFARETYDIYIDLDREQEVSAFVEENCRKNGQLINGKPVYDVSHLMELGKNKPLLIGAIGSTKRKRLLSELEKQGFAFDTVIHPSAIYSKWVEIGAGSIITPGVIMTCQVKIGRHVILNLGAHVGHDTVIGDYTTVSPSAQIMGFANLGNEVYVGTNAAILEHVKVGSGAVIAAGAVVTKDVPEMSLVAGVPAVVKKTYFNVEEKPW
jgi:sugar O-acyltransferase (sialic acid O-acetyltransferase NeuD family)